MYISQLFADIHSQDIQYVHWKSNLFIKDALRGIDDLDLLVNKRDRERIYRVLKNHDFIRVTSPKDSWQSSIVNYLGLDRDSGKLHHIHLHFELSVGHDFDKYYKCKFLDEIFATRRWCEEGVYLIDPNIEYVLLLIRYSLKLYLPYLLIQNIYKVVKVLLLNSDLLFSNRFISEFDYLCNKVEKDDLERFIKRYYSEDCLDYFAKFEDFIKKRDFRKILLHVCFDTLSDKYGEIGFKKAPNLFKYSGRLVANKMKQLFSNFMPYISNSKRFVGRGQIIAFVGCDGSGKSTTLENLRVSLSSVVKAQTLHYGKPHHNLVLKYLLLSVDKLCDLLKIDFLRALHWLLLAKMRSLTVARAQKLASRGYIVLLDRYPVPGFRRMDCPRIAPAHGKRFQKLANVERRLYSETLAPDILFVVNAEFEDIKIRRPDDNEADLRSRWMDVQKTDYTDLNFYSVDTSKDAVKSVNRLVLTEFWNSIVLNDKCYHEILGISGTGKSTLLSNLVMVNSGNYRIRLNLRDIASILVLLNIGELVKLKSRRELNLYLHFMCSIKRYQYFRFWSENQPCVLDQGPIYQLAFLLHRDIIGSRRAEGFRKILSKYAPKVIYLSSDHTVIYERITRREKRINSSNTDITNLIKKYSDIYEWILSDNNFESLTINTSELTPTEVHIEYNKCLNVHR